MKLFFCPNCNDVVNIIPNEYRYCLCKQNYGIFVDNRNALLSGNAIPIGIDNRSFLKAIENQPRFSFGDEFKAFVIPKQSKTVTRIVRIINQEKGERK